MPADWTHRPVKPGEERPLETLVPRHMPSPALEERVVATLGRRGLLVDPGPRWRRRRLALMAAAVLVFCAGMVTGSLGRRAGPAAGPPAALGRFLFLLYSDSTDAGAPAANAQEYVQWARQLRAAGHFVSGEELADGQRTVGPGNLTADSPTNPSPAGFFVIDAPDLQAADRIARSCPHVLHGGRIVIRSIVPT